jgi:hypothetical protein
MSQENVEIVGRFFGLLERFFDEYWGHRIGVVDELRQ